MVDASWLRKAELFESLEEPQLNVILSHSTIESCPEGHVIFRQGDEATHLYVLIDGGVDLTVKAQDQTDFMASQIQKEGAVLGIPSLIEPFRYNVTATCIIPTKVLRIDAGQVKNKMEEDPRMGMNIMKKLAFIYFTRLNNLRMGVSKLLKGLGSKRP
jgi:CRP-like cAMP-binding protein